jgi:hypothetical protein
MARTGRHAPTVLPGEKYGRLNVEAHAGTDKYGNRKVKCRCDCGADFTVVAARLKNGQTRSCGCLRSELQRASHRQRGRISRGLQTQDDVQGFFED